MSCWWRSGTGSIRVLCGSVVVIVLISSALSMCLVVRLVVNPKCASSWLSGLLQWKGVRVVVKGGGVCR